MRFAASLLAIAFALAGGRVHAEGLLSTISAPGENRTPAPSPASADPYDVPDAPRSFSIPELTHPDIEWTSTTSFGAVSGGGRGAGAGVERFSVELPIGPRRWFVGLAYEAAYAQPLTRSINATVVGGNPEMYGRAVWATRTGLAFGGGLGVLPPVASYDSDQGAQVASLGASVVPWDAAYFRVGRLTVRPYLDVRDLFGRFVVQVRSTLDYNVGVVRGADTGLAAWATLYLGWLASPILGVGLEASEYYRIDDSVPDAQRATFVFMPSVRFLTRYVQPALGAFVGAGTPLAPNVDRVWGVRLALTFVWRPPI